jgi:hypothetical protein
MARIAPGAIQERYKRFLQAWDTLAPTKTFGGHTLGDIQQLAGISETARETIDDLDTQMAGAIQARDDNDDTILAALDLVINGVRADKSVGGSDGALYKEMGYIPKSQRKPPTRKPKPSAG